MSLTVTPDDLKAFRMRHGLSQAVLAERLLVSKRNIENWESGSREPPSYLKLAMYFLDQIDWAKVRIEMIEAGSFEVGRNDLDVTEEFKADLVRQITEYETLLADFKRDGK